MSFENDGEEFEYDRKLWEDLPTGFLGGPHHIAVTQTRWAMVESEGDQPSNKKIHSAKLSINAVTATAWAKLSQHQPLNKKVIREVYELNCNGVRKVA